jgi:uncharacterized Zn finger protein
MSLTFRLNDPCPKCGASKMQAVIEAHPSRTDLALHNFHCADCGPVKTKVISLTPPVRSADVAA